MISKILLFLLLSSAYAAQGSHNKSEIDTILLEFSEPLTEWVGFADNVLEVAASCQLKGAQKDLLNFHTSLAQIGEHFTRKHIQFIQKTFKEKKTVKQFFKCMVSKRNTQNQYFGEQRKLKYLSQFIKDYPDFSMEIFYSEEKAIDKGYRLGRFFRAFFQYYYQYILHPAETSSTKLIRSMTPKTDIFGHEDISPCLSLETSGKMSENLQNLGIQNIYIKIPDLFNAIKYMKFKDRCKSQKYSSMVQKIHKRLQKIDMFKIMYHEYNPWVEVAAEKYGSKQIQQIGQIFSKVINNQQYYEQISAIEQM